MEVKLQNKLFKKYPKLFRQKDLPMTETCMCWGIETGQGWYWLIDQLCSAIQGYIDSNKRLNIQQVEVVQLKEKFGCYDEKTEVLTETGWKFFKDVTKNDKIATLKDGEFLEYNHPSDLIEYEYEGKMYCLKTRGVNLVVTPNHNLYVSKGSYYNGRYSPPKKVMYPFELTNYEKYFGKNKCFKKNTTWNGVIKAYFQLPKYKYSADVLTSDKRKSYLREYTRNSVKFNMNDWLNFLGWYVAEGHTGKHHDEISISHNTIDDNKERDIIKKSINELGYKCKKAIGMLRMYDVQLGDWLVKNCGHLARNKKVPDFIKNLDREQIKVFLKSLYQGDGHKSKTAHTLYTISKKLCDDVQELILKVGDASRFSVATPRKSFLKGREINSTYPCYCINWMKKSNYHNTQNKGMSPSSVEKLIDYSGKVYCITVPNNIIYVRRNGIPVWCGNSLRFYINGGDDHIDGMISFAEHLSYNICEECGSTDRVKQTKGWITSLCCKCFAKNKLAETRLLKNKQKELSNSNKV